MNWFNKIVMRYARKLMIKEGNQTQASVQPTRLVSVDDDHLESNQTLNFRVIPAQGGAILSIRKYDQVKDRTYTGLHIITIDQDYASEIGKIIALELYKS